MTQELFKHTICMKFFEFIINNKFVFKNVDYFIETVSKNYYVNII